MRRYARALLRWTSLSLMGVTAACLFLGVVAAQSSYRYQLSEARGRWQTSALSHYRLVSESGESCILDVEVRDERVVTVYKKDSCLHPARTVTDLFNLVERGQFSYGCVFAGCACSMNIIVHADYDPVHGYPQQVSVRSQRGANWWDQSFWRYTWSTRSLPPCSRTGEADMVRVVSLTPIQ